LNFSEENGTTKFLNQYENVKSVFKNIAISTLIFFLETAGPQFGYQSINHNFFDGAKITNVITKSTEA